MDALYAHLHKSMATPFKWGESDCMLDVANYLLLLTGIDCAKDLWRGKYTTALECQRLTNFIDDPVRPFAMCAATFPLNTTVNPVRGDVGVVVVINERKLKTVGGIFLGKNWAVKAEVGLTIGPIKTLLKAWKAPESA